MKLEILYPEVANLYGDLMNAEYLRRSDSRIELINTSLREEPRFLTEDIALVYMGSVTEQGQAMALEALRPHRDAIFKKIDEGQLFLVTGNALELFGAGIEDDNGRRLEGLKLFPLRAELTMMKRYNALYLGRFEEEGIDIVGFKSLFGHLYGESETEPLFRTLRGDGRHPGESAEGVRIHNFMGTYLMGPLLILNPPLAEYLLRRMGSDAPAAYHDAAYELYRQRVAQFSDPATGIIY